jgi:dTDP-4-amino-4,6-dideoxygalactose transaminase
VSKAAREIVLFHPHVPKAGAEHVARTLQTRWIGQGPRVAEFEQRFLERFAPGRAGIAVSSGTSALHLAYILAGISEGDEVIAPVLTCTATNIPLLYLRAKPVFADIDPANLNIDVSHVRWLITDRTRAIVCVHYGGFPCDMQELNDIACSYRIPVIQDAAHAVGARYHERNLAELSDFTAFSFQAIKHITTGDGGFLVTPHREAAAVAARLRWFGLERQKDPAIGGAIFGKLDTSIT